MVITVRIVIVFQTMTDSEFTVAARAGETRPGTTAVSTAIRNKLIKYFVDLTFVFMGFSFKKYLLNSRMPFERAVA
jgi:hypothetical protein